MTGLPFGADTLVIPFDGVPDGERRAAPGMARLQPWGSMGVARRWPAMGEDAEGGVQVAQAGAVTMSDAVPGGARAANVAKWMRLAAIAERVRRGVAVAGAAVAAVGGAEAAGLVLIGGVAYLAIVAPPRHARIEGYDGSVLGVAPVQADLDARTGIVLLYRGEARHGPLPGTRMAELSLGADGTLYDATGAVVGRRTGGRSFALAEGVRPEDLFRSSPHTMAGPDGEDDGQRPARPVTSPSAGTGTPDPEFDPEQSQPSAKRVSITEADRTLPSGLNRADFARLAEFEQGQVASGRASTEASARVLANLRAAGISRESIAAYKAFYEWTAIQSPNNIAAVHWARLLANILRAY